MDRDTRKDDGLETAIAFAKLELLELGASKRTLRECPGLAKVGLRVRQAQAYDWGAVDVKNEVDKRMERVGGGVVCGYCGVEYRKHPLEYRVLDWRGEPFLNQLCNGILGKL